MPKYNLYRIPKNKEDNLIAKLKSSGSEKISERKVGNFNAEFFFSSKPDEVDIWWSEIYKEFLPAKLNPPKNSIYFGVFLVSGEQVCYAASLGKAHFYLSKFCDTNFGLNLAERIIDQNSLKVKNSKYYKNTKSKAITAYKQGSDIVCDGGESIHYIKGKTIDPDTWGETVSFGTSVHLRIKSSPIELINLINHIEYTLNQPVKVELPKVDIVENDEEIKCLDKILAETILQSQEDSEINIEEFTISGVDFIFTNSHEYSFYLKGKSDEAIRLKELSMESLVSFINEKNINLKEEINNLKVKIHNEFGRDRTNPLKFYLDCIERDGRHCLIDGKWYKFNQSYVDYLKEEVDKIKLCYHSKFDIDSKMTEAEFNKARVLDGYENHDKNLEMIKDKYKVEKMDLYKDNTLYFVKKGTPQKVSYVIDQAINTVKIIQNNTDVIKISGEKIEITKICLWMLLDRKTKIEKLSEINSIIFHMKLVDWRRICIEANLKPLININYKKDEIKK